MYPPGTQGGRVPKYPNRSAAVKVMPYISIYLSVHLDRQIYRWIDRSIEIYVHVQHVPAGDLGRARPEISQPQRSGEGTALQLYPSRYIDTQIDSQKYIHICFNMYPSGTWGRRVPNCLNRNAVVKVMPYISIQIDRQTDLSRQIDRQIDRQSDIQIDRQIYRRLDRWTDMMYPPQTWGGRVPKYPNCSAAVA